MRTAFQLPTLTAGLLLIVGTAAVSPAQTGQAPPKELVEYIHSAKQRGVAEDKIKKQAVTVGWSAAMVDDAIAYEKSGKSPPAGVAAKPEKPQQASNRLQPMVPSAPSIAASEVPAVEKTAEKMDAPGGVPAAPGMSSDEYLIGSGDTLQISVWKEAELSVPTVVVRPDGKITIPLIKDVMVAGLTPRQVEALITQGISKFIEEPNVTVVVALPTSKKIYLIGGVRKEGTLPYTYGMSVIQALSEAGGLTDYAKRKKIYVLRTENGREYRLDFNYDEVVKGEKMEQNVLLLPGDTVVVPQY